MLRAFLIGILLLVGLLVVSDLARQHEAAARTAAALAIERRPSPATASAPRPPVATPPPQLVVASPQEADGPRPATPAIDLMERLAIRRRIDREGSRIYLDSLLIHTDSVLARWADRPDATLTVAFLGDTSIVGWTTSARDDARAGMHQWDGNQAGLRFREITDPDSADIRVQWVTTLADPGQVGSTTLTWGPDGVAHAGVITLALRRNTDSAALSPAARQHVATHEFGHALGLPHSGSSDDVMFPTSPIAAPSRRDQATLLLLYTVPPGSLRTPP